MYREFDSNTEPGIIQTEEKKKTGTDRRVARTKRSVRMALIKLLASKPLGEITVTELARAADINRKTFYNYYSDVSMVVDEIENEIAEDFASAIHDIDFREISREPSEIFLTLARLIEKDLEFYANVFAAEGQASLRPSSSSSGSASPIRSARTGETWRNLSFCWNMPSPV